MAKKKSIEDQNLENVQEALVTTTSWVERNKNLISWVVLAVIVVVLAVLAFQNYYLIPKSNEADNEVAKSVVYFNQNNWEQALNGDDAECAGFLATADEYSTTKGGKLAALYAGICYYNLEQYEDAIKYLKKFDANDLNVAPAAHQKIGDAYVALDQTKEAISYFEKAAASKNEIIAPMALKKAGLAYLSLGDGKAAKKAFETIKADYPTSAEAQDIDKYIESIVL